MHKVQEFMVFRNIQPLASEAYSKYKKFILMQY